MRTNLIRGVLRACRRAGAVRAPALAQSVVRGKVVDARASRSRAPSSRSRPTDANRKAETKTDNKGEFLQVGLPSGEYKVTATKDRRRHADADRRQRHAGADRSS